MRCFRRNWKKLLKNTQFKHNLEHLINKNGLNKDPEKVRATLEMSFVDSLVYYESFIPRLSEL